MMLVAIVLLSLVAATSYWYSRSIRKIETGIPAPAGTPDFFVEQVVFTQFDAQGRALSGTTSTTWTGKAPG